MARSWRTGRQWADQGLILGMRPSSSQPGAPPWVRGLFELLRHYSGLILPRTGCVPLLHPGATLPPVPRPSELLQSHPANSRASPASRLSLGPEEKPPKPPKPKGQLAADAPGHSTGVCAFAYRGGKPVSGQEDKARAADGSPTGTSTRQRPPGPAGSSCTVPTSTLGERA